MKMSCTISWSVFIHYLYHLLCIVTSMTVLFLVCGIRQVLLSIFIIVLTVWGPFFCLCLLESAHQVKFHKEYFSGFWLDLYWIYRTVWDKCVCVCVATLSHVWLLHAKLPCRSLSPRSLHKLAQEHTCNNEYFCT